MSLQTKNIFIDTQYFDKSNLNFQSTALEELIRLVKQDRARVLLTSVTKGEVESHISEQIRYAANAVKRFKGKDAGRVLRNLSKEIPFSSIFDPFDERTAETDLLAKFEAFLRSAQVTIVDLKATNPDDIFRAYFERRPPFQSDAKKSEFPDAFSQAALEQWCIARKTRSYVVSEDHDWHAYTSASKSLISLTSVQEFLDLALREEQLAQLALELFGRHHDEVEQLIENAFQYAGFNLDGEWGDVSEVRITRMTVGDPLVIEVDENSATLAATVDVTYDADVSYDDVNNGIRDEGEWVHLPSKYVTVKQLDEFEAEVLIQFDSEDSDSPDGVDLDVSISKDFAVKAHSIDHELK